MFWSTGKKITSEVGLSSIVLQDGWRYRFSKKSISVGFFFRYFGIFNGGQVLIEFTIYSRFSSIQWVPAVSCSFYWAEALEHAHSSGLEHTPPSGHGLQQLEKPLYIEGFKIQPPKHNQSDDNPITLSKWTYLEEVLACAIQFQENTISQPFDHLAFQDCNAYFIHLQPATLGVHVIPSTLGQPLRHKNPANSSRKGKLQRENSGQFQVSNYISLRTYLYAWI